MLVLVVVMFGLCWLPLQAFFLVLDFNPQLQENPSRANQRLFTVIYYTVFWLAMSNSSANPIIYGFTNESFRSDLSTLCYLRFPFCLCLKQMANRKLSVSTFESTYNKRAVTVRKSPGTSLSRQGGCRNGSRVYIELQKDISRVRSQPNMSEQYKEAMENEQLKKCPNGRPSHHSSYLRCNRQQQPLHLRPFFRTDSEGSSQPLSLNNHIELGDRVSSVSSTIDRVSSVSSTIDRSRAPTTPTPAVTDFSFTGVSDNNNSSRLIPLKEVKISYRTQLSHL